MKRLNVLAIVCVALLGYAYAQALTSHPGVPPCVPKPYPVTIDLSKFPPEMHEGLIKFVDDMNYRIIDEIYLRFCNYIADSIYPGCDSICIHIDSLLDLTDTLVIVDSLIWDSLTNALFAVPCTISVNIITTCDAETLLVDAKAIRIKDSTGGTFPGTLILQEDTSKGGQFAALAVTRHADTNNISTSYTLILPADKGGGNQRPVIVEPYNSELIVDSSGNLRWYDRNVFHGKMYVDSIIADSMHDAHSGYLWIDAEIYYFSNHGLHGGDPPGRKGGVLFVFHDSTGSSPSDQIVWDYPDALKDNWEWEFPDTCPEFNNAILQFDKQSSTTVSTLEYIPSDEAYSQWGHVNSIDGQDRDTIFFDEKFYNSSSFVVMLQWGENHPALGTAQWDSLFCLTTLSGSLLQYKSDSSAIVVLPYAGDKTVIWHAVGNHKKYLGVGGT